MRGRAAAAMAFVLGTALACGGLPAQEVEAALSDSCESNPAMGMPTVELVELNEKLESPKLAVNLLLDGEAWMLDGESVPREASALEDFLTEKAEIAKDLAARTGSEAFAFRGQLLVTAAPHVRGEELLAVARAAHEAGFVDLKFVVSTGKRELPELLDPAYGAQFEASVDGKEAMGRQMAIAAELEELLVLCPPAIDAFGAVAHASAEMKCRMITVGMSEALPKCPLTNGRKVVTLIQVMSRGLPMTLGVIEVNLDQEGELFEVDPQASWKDLAGPLASEVQDGKPVWLVAP